MPVEEFFAVNLLVSVVGDVDTNKIKEFVEQRLCSGNSPKTSFKIPQIQLSPIFGKLMTKPQKTLRLIFSKKVTQHLGVFKRGINLPAGFQTIRNCTLSELLNQVFHFFSGYQGLFDMEFVVTDNPGDH